MAVEPLVLSSPSKKLVAVGVVLGRAVGNENNTGPCACTDCMRRTFLFVHLHAQAVHSVSELSEKEALATVVTVAIVDR